VLSFLDDGERQRALCVTCIILAVYLLCICSRDRYTCITVYLNSLYVNLPSRVLTFFSLFSRTDLLQIPGPDCRDGEGDDSLGSDGALCTRLLLLMVAFRLDLFGMHGSKRFGLCSCSCWPLANRPRG
jgi:hypothetical protein